MGGVGGKGGRSAGVSFSTWVRGVIFATAAGLERKLNELDFSCTSALGGGVDSR